MRLREWKDANGKKVSLTSSSTPASRPTKSSSNTSSNSFKKRLAKLFRYYSQYVPAEVKYSEVTKLTHDALEFTERCDDGTTAEYKIYIGPTTEAWRIKIFVDGQLSEDLVGTGWVSLLNNLDAYIIVPAVNTPEYQDLLTEWVDKTGKKVSLNNTSTTSQPASKTSTKTNKEKFKELTDYMSTHKCALATKADVVRLDDGGFTYKEHWLTSYGESYILTLLVGYSRFNSSWRLELYKDTAMIRDVQGSGMVDLLRELKRHFQVPSAMSTEYQSITEEASFADDFKLYENLWD